MKKKFKLLFSARKFHNMAGGLERISIDLMNSMVKRGHSVGLISWDKSDAIAHYKINKKVKWYKLNIGNPDVPASIPTVFARIRKFRLMASKFSPDIILGFQSGGALFPIISTFGKGFNVISAERVSPDLWKYVGRSIKAKFYIFFTFLFSIRITVQFPQYIDHYLPIFRKKILSIHNPVYPAKLKKKINRKSRSPKTILCVGRLCFQKNQDLLIDAFQELSSYHKEWKLVFVGDGNHYKRLNQKVKNYGLQSRIQFHKPVKNINKWYQKSDIFAFPSYFEGFPNALAEALSFGLPCIGLKNTMGVNILINNKINGLLVDTTPTKFAKALKVLMSDSKLRKKMSLEAKKINLKYSPDKSYFLWEKLFKNVTT